MTMPSLRGILAAFGVAPVKSGGVVYDDHNINRVAWVQVAPWSLRWGHLRRVRGDCTADAEAGPW